MHVVKEALLLIDRPRDERRYPDALTEFLDRFG
jgi:hypothetical protein